jgi:hypothetical protein
MNCIMLPLSIGTPARTLLALSTARSSLRRHAEA